MKTYNLLIPELVPLDNKGEEAIIRGIADVIFPSGNCEIHLFDNVNDYYYNDKIHVYPVKWFISPWLNKEFGLGFSFEKISNSFFSLLRNSLHKIYPNWIYTKCSQLRKTSILLKYIKNGKTPHNDKEKKLFQLLNCDYIIAGHDGALDERVCHVIDVFSDLGTPFGVFGVEFPSKFKSLQIIDVQNRTLAKSNFFYCRTQASHDIVKKHFPLVKSEVLADPAFGMAHSSDISVEYIIKRNNLEVFFEKPVVMCTSCEPSPISRYCFEAVKIPSLKLNAHRQLYAELIKFISEKFDANILFLPHAIGPGIALDDRTIAHDILSKSGLNTTRALLLNDILSAKDLKGLIAKADFLVAERIHSMIGAVGAGTPFICLGSSTDRRIKGIISEIAKMHDHIYYLNNPDFESLTAFFTTAWINRHKTKIHLQNVYTEIQSNLDTAANLMRKEIVKYQTSSVVDLKLTDLN